MSAGFFKPLQGIYLFCWTEFYEEESLRALVLGLVLSVLCFFSSAPMKSSFVSSTFFFGCCFFVESSWIAKKSVRVFLFCCLCFVVSKGFVCCSL